MSFLGNMNMYRIPKEAFAECSDCKKKGVIVQHVKGLDMELGDMLPLFQCPNCRAVVCRDHVSNGFTCSNCFTQLRRS